MYCPRCGAENSQPDAKFCRACGVDLTLVSQALTGRISWRTYAVSKLDDFLLSKREYENRESAREGGWNIAIGSGLLAASVWSLLSGEGAPILWLYLLFLALFSLKIGIGNYRLYKRYLAGDSPPEIRPDRRDLTVLNLGEGRGEKGAQTLALPRQSSVTEGTTKLLDETGKLTK